MNQLERKYGSIKYGILGNTSLISTREKTLLWFFSNSVYVFLTGATIVSLLSINIHGLDGYLMFSLGILTIYTICSVIYSSRRIMYHLVTKLGKEYYDYREDLLINNHIIIYKIPNGIDAWREFILESKHFSNGFCVYKKRIPLMFTKGIVYYFDYCIIVVWENNPDDDVISALIDKKKINIVFCVKQIVLDNQDKSNLKSLVIAGYTEKDIDHKIIRFAYIYIDAASQQLIHRPRVLMLYPQDHVMKKFKYASQPSVIVDYSIEISDYVCRNILKLSTDSHKECDT